MIPREINIELIALFNKALALEHSAAIQYGAHAEQISGPMSEPIMERLHEQADDEVRHAKTLRNLIGDYLLAVPTMQIGPTREADDELPSILEANILSEKDAIAVYEQILAKLDEVKPQIMPIYAKLEHGIRHILMDEQEHVAELTRLG